MNLYLKSWILLCHYCIQPLNLCSVLQQSPRSASALFCGKHGISGWRQKFWSGLFENSSHISIFSFNLNSPSSHLNIWCGLGIAIGNTSATDCCPLLVADGGNKLDLVLATKQWAENPSSNLRCHRNFAEHNSIYWVLQWLVVWLAKILKTH